MKSLLLLACLAVAATPQATVTRRFVPTGSAQFDPGSAGLVIRYGGRDWTVEFSKLPIRPDECEAADVRQKCAEGGGLACLPCVREWQPVAWDELREVFYMAASTASSGQNRPWVIFRYDLRTGKLTRLADYYGGGFDGSGTVSPTGRYLAYVQYWSMGVCGTSSNLAVIDTETQTSRLYQPPTANDDENAAFTAIRWAGTARLEYDFKIQRESECEANPGAPPASRSSTAEVEVRFPIR